MTRNELTIRNCVFAFKCKRDWQGMQDTKDEKIKFCSDCNRQVHFCETDAELAKAVKFNECVAIIDPATYGEFLGQIEHSGYYSPEEASEAEGWKQRNKKP